MGISTYPSDSDNLKGLIHRADQALYQAKESGRNKTIVWEKEFNSKLSYKEDEINLNANIQNSRNILAIVELIQLMNENITMEEKIYSYLGRIIDSLEVQYGYIFLIENNRVVEKFGRSRNNDKWLKGVHYNKSIVNNVMKSKEGRFLVDWTDVNEKDIVMGLPLWNSIIAYPIVRKSHLKALIYLVSPLKFKEFNKNDYNMVDVFGNILNIW